jgi:hypothetical protein
MVERSFADPVKAVEVNLETNMSRPGLSVRDRWLVFTAGILGAIVGVLAAVGVYLILLEGM